MTRAELEAVSVFLVEIAVKRVLSAGTVSNQIRSGCSRPSFGERRELKSWWTAASGYIWPLPGHTGEPDSLKVVGTE